MAYLKAAIAITLDIGDTSRSFVDCNLFKWDVVMFRSCKISTDTCVVWSLCNSRASCLCIWGNFVSLLLV